MHIIRENKSRACYGAAFETGSGPGQEEGVRLASSRMPPASLGCQGALFRKW